MFELGLHYLLRPVCPHIEGKYGNLQLTDCLQGNKISI